MSDSAGKACGRARGRARQTGEEARRPGTEPERGGAAAAPAAVHPTQGNGGRRTHRGAPRVDPAPSERPPEPSIREVAAAMASLSMSDTGGRGHSRVGADHFSNDSTRPAHIQDKRASMDKKTGIQCKNVVASNKMDNFSRRDLLNWINTLLDTEVQRVEELCSGAIYCSLLNILFPGCVQMKKIKSNANQQHEYITNLRVLQIALTSIGCNKAIPIDRLILARFQDNFEFLQWFKEFFDANYNPDTAGPSCSKPLRIHKTASQKALILKSNKKPLSGPAASGAAASRQVP